MASADINTLLNVSLSGIILYDYNQDQGFQCRQNLALGIVLDRNRPE